MVRRGTMKRLALTTSLAASLVLATVASVAAEVTIPVRVSGPSPYATTACISTDAGQAGKNYLNGEEEPQLAVNPADTTNFIGMFHQDRWSNGGAHGIGGAFSTTGGGDL